MSMIVVQQKKGTVFAKCKERIKELFVILKGRVRMSVEDEEFVLEKGSLIGLAECIEGRYLCDYEAVEDCLLVSYSFENKDDLKDILDEQPQYNYAFLYATTGFCQMLLERYHHNVTLAREIYLFIVKQNGECLSVGRKFISEMAIPGKLASISPLHLSDAIPQWEIDYNNNLAGVPADVIKEIFGDNKELAAGRIFTLSVLTKRAIVGMLEAREYVNHCLELILDKERLGYIDLWFEIAKKAVFINPDIEDIKKKAAYVKQFLLERHLGDEEYIRNRYEEFINFDFEEYVNEMSREEETGQQATGDDLENIDMFEYIINFAQDDESRKDEYRQIHNEYLTTINSDVRGTEAAEVRKQITDVFYELYDKAFFLAVEQEEISEMLELFFNFGYLDSHLVSQENTQALLALNRKIKSLPAEGVFTAFSWLKSIYEGKNETSRNEFGLDYAASLRELRKANRITADDEKFYQVDRARMVRFEIDNMLKTAVRATCGRVNSFTPIMEDANITRNVESMWISPERLDKAIKAVTDIDFSCFYREIAFMDDKYETGRLHIQKEIRPYILLTPNVGRRAMMWQECGSHGKDSPARFLFPIMSIMNVDEEMLENIGRYRWEICRKIQGMRWNDISEHSLTSDYFDYLQFYKKNKELSSVVKEKLKMAISRNKGNFREVFVADYVNWIKYESKGNFRVNKVARAILSQYVPFNQEIRYGLLENPIFRVGFSKYENRMIQKETKYKNTLKKYKDNGGEITEEMMDTLHFYQR